ncbi:unnamed protein product [Rangifer tarandus platyrhynchus]|uniref:Uncharacterized protein n=2 Tax=Rangifer tarandus platyrhynchus TaxID=3082113 RepID=A0ABN8YQG4_RANTA|nr:unnamed protein product [Rangifer tarandus platyrhynchus]
MPPAGSPSGDLGQRVAACLVLVSLLLPLSLGSPSPPLEFADINGHKYDQLETHWTNTQKDSALQQLLSQGLLGCQISHWPGPACNAHSGQGSGALALLHHPETSRHIQKVQMNEQC